VDLEEAWKGCEGVRRDEGTFEVLKEGREGRGCSGEVSGGEGFEFRVGGRIGEKRVEFTDGLKAGRQYIVHTAHGVNSTFCAICQSAKADVIVDSSPIFFAVATS
jgi:hypothetical protein